MQNDVMGRERTFNMRLSDDEWTRLKQLGAFHGLNDAGLIRFLLKKEERSLGDDLPRHLTDVAMSKMVKPAKKATKVKK